MLTLRFGNNEVIIEVRDVARQLKFIIGDKKTTIKLLKPEMTVLRTIINPKHKIIAYDDIQLALGKDFAGNSKRTADEQRNRYIGRKVNEINKKAYPFTNSNLVQNEYGEGYKLNPAFAVEGNYHAEKMFGDEIAVIIHDVINAINDLPLIETDDRNYKLDHLSHHLETQHIRDRYENFRQRFHDDILINTEFLIVEGSELLYQFSEFVHLEWKHPESDEMQWKKAFKNKIYHYYDEIRLLLKRLP